MPDINMQVFEEVKRNQLVTEVDIQTQVALDDYQMHLSDIANPTQSQDNVVIDRHGEFLPHWNESLDFDTWVKMSMEIAGKKLLMIHGGVELSSGSNITDAMIFGDDFLSTLDYTSKWVSNAQASYSTSNGNLEVQDQDEVYNNCLNSQNNFSNGYIIETRFKASGSTPCELYIQSEASKATNTVNDIIRIRLADSLITGIGGVYDTGINGVDGTWYRGLLKIPASGDAGAYIYSDNGQTLHTSKTGTPATRTGYIFIHQRPNSLGYVDWIFVRKHTTTEPTYTIGTPKNILITLKSLGRAG